MLHRSLTLIACALLVCGCESLRWGADPERSEALARSAAGAATVTEPGVAGAPAAALRTRPAVSPIEAALADSRRLAGDRLLDERRRTADLLRFFRIEPEMAVAQLYSGSGYYSEALSLVVGSRGRVLAHNSPASAEGLEMELAARFGGGRLGNVQQLLVENHALSLAPESLDAVLLLHAYHEAYHTDRSGGWSPVDGPALLREIYRALRPGGVLGVADYVALPDMLPGQAAFLGRIDPQRLAADVQAAGFVLEAQSDLWRNPADDRRGPVFAPGVRESADQVVFRFRKPK